MVELTEDQIERYSRQLLLPGWGTREQRALGDAYVTVSARAEAAALYLAGAGVGRISLLFAADDVLATRLRRLNPDLEINHWRSNLPSPDAVLILADEEAPQTLVKDTIMTSETNLSAQTLLAARLIKRLIAGRGQRA